MKTEKHLKEMLNAPSNIRYLKDVVKEAVVSIRKSKSIEDYERDFFIECAPVLERYGLCSGAMDGVVDFMTDICRGNYDKIILHAKILLSNYVRFDAEGGEASILLKKAEEIEAKHTQDNKKRGNSPHSLESMINFREQMEGSL